MIYSSLYFQSMNVQARRNPSDSRLQAVINDHDTIVSVKVNQEFTVL